jgi:uncharacterized protein
MSSSLPVQVDPWWASDQRLHFAGSLKLADFPRLAPLLATDDGEVSCAIRFSRDSQGRPQVAGHLDAILWQVCQRCLQPVAVAVNTDMRLVLVQGLDEAANLDDHLDPLLAGAGGVNLRDLLEDELLLALPDVARHADCSAWHDDDETVSEEPKVNPFSILQKLKH